MKHPGRGRARAAARSARTTPDLSTAFSTNRQADAEWSWTPGTGHCGTSVTVLIGPGDSSGGALHRDGLRCGARMDRFGAHSFKLRQQAGTGTTRRVLMLGRSPRSCTRSIIFWPCSRGNQGLPLVAPLRPANQRLARKAPGPAGSETATSASPCRTRPAGSRRGEAPSRWFCRWTVRSSGRRSVFSVTSQGGHRARSAPGHDIIVPVQACGFPRDVTRRADGAFR